MPPKTKSKTFPLQNEIAQILKSEIISPSSIRGNELISSTKSIPRSELADIAKHFAKDLLKFIRSGLSQAKKDTKDSDVVIILENCSYYLEIIVLWFKYNDTNNNNTIYSELEIEKCLYHLISKSCEFKQFNHIENGLLMLKTILDKNNDDDDDDENENKMKLFPKPKVDMSVELLRLISGSLINAIQSLIVNSSKGNQTLNIFKLIDNNCYWIRSMLDRNDIKGLDYIDRMSKYGAFLIHQIDHGNEEALNTLTTLLLLRWNHQASLCVSSFFNEVYCIGVRAQKAQLTVEMVHCYQKLIHASEDCAEKRKSPLSDVSILSYMKCLTHFNTLCQQSELQLENSLPLFEQVINQMKHHLQENEMINKENSFKEIIISNLQFQYFLSLIKQKKFKNIEICFQKKNQDKKSKQLKSKEELEVVTWYLESSIQSLVKSMGVVEYQNEKQVGKKQEVVQGEEKEETDNDSSGLLIGLRIACWRVMLNLPSTNISADVQSETKFIYFLDVFCGLTSTLLQQFKSFQQTSIDENHHHHQQYLELKKLYPHMNNSMIEAMTKSVSLKCHSLTQKYLKANDNNIEEEEGDDNDVDDEKSVFLNEASHDVLVWLSRAESSMTSSAHAKRVSLAYSLFGKTLISVRSVLLALYPLCKSCHLIGQLFKSAIKTIHSGNEKKIDIDQGKDREEVEENNDDDKKEVERQQRIALFEDLKLSPRLIGLSNSLVEIGSYDKAAVVMRYIIVKHLEVYGSNYLNTTSCLQLTREFVKIQFRSSSSSSSSLHSHKNNANEEFTKINKFEFLKVFSEDEISTTEMKQAALVFDKKTDAPTTNPKASSSSVSSSSSSSSFLSLFSGLKHSQLPPSLQLNMLLLELNAQCHLLETSASIQSNEMELKKLHLYHEYLFKKIKSFFTSKHISSNDLCELQRYASMTISVKFSEYLMLAMLPQSSLGRLMKEASNGDSNVDDDGRIRKLIHQYEFEMKVGLDRMTKAIDYFTTQFTGLSSSSSSSTHSKTAVCMEAASSFIVAFSFCRLLSHLHSPQFLSKQSEHFENYLSQALEVCEFLLDLLQQDEQSQSSPSSATAIRTKCKHCVSVATQFHRLNDLLIMISDYYTSTGDILKQVKAYHIRLLLHELITSNLSSSSTSPNTTTEQLSLSGLISAEDISRNLKGTNAAIYPMDALCQLCQSLPSSSHEIEEVEVEIDQTDLLSQELGNVLLELEKDEDLDNESEKETNILLLQNLSTSSSANSSNLTNSKLSEPTSRVQVLAHTTTSQIHRRQGDFEESILSLKNAASYSGGRAGGIFSKIPSSSSSPSASSSTSTTKLHDDDGLKSIELKPCSNWAVFPVSSASWWWIHRYVHILLAIADTLADSGNPQRSMQYIEWALRMSTVSHPLQRVAMFQKVGLLTKLGKFEEVESILDFFFINKVEENSNNQGGSKGTSQQQNLPVIQQCLLFVLRGDIEKKKKKSNRILENNDEAPSSSAADDHNEEDSHMNYFETANSYYNDAFILSKQITEAEFINPLMTLLVRPEEIDIDIEAFSQRTVSLVEEIKLRQARMATLLNQKERGGSHVALKLYQEIINSPSFSYTHAKAHYRIARIYLEKQTFSISMVLDHLFQCFKFIRKLPHSKLFRNVLRTIASLGDNTATSPQSKNEKHVEEIEHTLSQNVNCWLLFKSIGCTTSSALLDKLKKQTDSDLAQEVGDILSEIDGTQQLKSLNNFQELKSPPIQQYLDDINMQLITCALSVTPSGDLLMSRLQPNRKPLLRKHPHKFPMEIVFSFDEIMKQNRKQLSEHRDIDPNVGLDRNQRNAWWQQRHILDEALLNLIQRFEFYLGSWKCLFVTDFENSVLQQKFETNWNIVISQLRSLPLGGEIDYQVLRLCLLSTVTSQYKSEQPIAMEQINSFLSICLPSSTCLSSSEVLGLKLMDCIGDLRKDFNSKDDVTTCEEEENEVEEEQETFDDDDDDDEGDDIEDEVMDLKEISKLKVSELKDHLLSLNESTKGLKKDLVDRLYNAVSKQQLDKKKSINSQKKKSKDMKSSASKAPRLEQTPSANTKGKTLTVDCDSTVIPLVLVLDEQLQRFPLEGLECLAQKTVSRIPSLTYLFVHGIVMRAQQKQLINSPSSSKLTNKDMQSVSLSTKAKAIITNASYILDPENNLSRTQSSLSPLFSEMHAKFGWKGFIGKAPSEDEFREILTKQDLLIYCGHGSGERLLRRDKVEALNYNLESFSFAILMGCSSGYLHLYGEYEPNGYALALLLSGKTCLVANLWDVTDKDIDLFTEQLLNSWSSSSTTDCRDEQGLTLQEAVNQSRGVCKLKGLSSCAPVCYGIPVGCLFVPK